MGGLCSKPKEDKPENRQSLLKKTEQEESIGRAKDGTLGDGNIIAGVSDFEAFANGSDLAVSLPAHIPVSSSGATTSTAPVPASNSGSGEGILLAGDAPNLPSDTTTAVLPAEQEDAHSNGTLTRGTLVAGVELTPGRELPLDAGLGASVSAAPTTLKVAPPPLQTVTVHGAGALPVLPHTASGVAVVAAYTTNPIEAFVRAVSSKDFTEIRSVIESNPAVLVRLTENAYADLLPKTPDITKLAALFEIIEGWEGALVKTSVTDVLSRKISEVISANDALKTRDTTNIFFNLNQFFRVKKYKIDDLQQKLVAHYLKFEDAAVGKLLDPQPKPGETTGEESPLQQFLSYKQIPALRTIVGSKKLPPEAILELSRQICDSRDLAIIISCGKVIAENYPAEANALLKFAFEERVIDLVAYFKEANLITLPDAINLTSGLAKVLRAKLKSGSASEDLKGIVKEGIKIIVHLLPTTEEGTPDVEGGGDIDRASQAKLNLLLPWSKKHSAEIWSGAGEMVPFEVRAAFDEVRDSGSSVSKLTTGTALSRHPYARLTASAHGTFQEEEGDEADTDGDITTGGGAGRCGAGGPTGEERDSLDGSFDGDAVEALLSQDGTHSLVGAHAHTDGAS